MTDEHSSELSLNRIFEITGEPHPDLQDRVEAIVTEILELLQDKTDKHTVRPEVRYDLRGQTAGQACTRNSPHFHQYIRLNLDILNNPAHTEEMLTQTLPHEIAHIFVRQHYPNASAHGSTWKYIMHLLGLPARRCHQYEVTKARKTPPRTKHAIYCNCDKPHYVTGVILRRMAAGTQYYCKRCRSNLRTTQ